MNRNHNIEDENEEVWPVNTVTENWINYSERAIQERKKYGRILPLTQKVLQNTSWANKSPRTPQRPTRKLQPQTPTSRKTYPRFMPSPPGQKRNSVGLHTPNQKRSKGGKRKTYRHRK
jgi:hypothetical protein